MSREVVNASIFECASSSLYDTVYSLDEDYFVGSLNMRVTLINKYSKYFKST